jgi:hypothetical protein
MSISLSLFGFLPRRLKSLHDDFRKLLGYGDGTHVDNELIDLAIFVEVHLIDRLKLLALDLALKAKKVPIVPASAVNMHFMPGAVLATCLMIEDPVFTG